MRSLFDPESPLMTALGKFADIVLCNIAFVLLSLPIFSIGAALTALHSCTQSIIEDTEQPFILKQYWFEFRRNFKQATLLWLFCILIFAVLGSYYLAISFLTGVMSRIYRTTFFVLCIVFLFGFQYIFPLQAKYNMKISHLLKNAWLLSIAALPWTILSIAVSILSVYISFFMNSEGVSIAVFLWGVCIFGIVTYINNFFFRQAFKRLQKEE